MTKLETIIYNLNLSPQDELRRLYLMEFKSCSEIAKIYGVDQMTIYNHLKKYDIPRRNLKEAGKITSRSGSNNPMYGRRYTDEEKQAKSEQMKKIIASKGQHWSKGIKHTTEQNKRKSLLMKGSGNPRWNGGKRFKTDGYVEVYSPDHPNRNKARNTVYEHRLVMEKHLGRYLKPDEVVHHINENTIDNRIENLQLFKNGEHVSFHSHLRPPKLKKERIKRIRPYFNHPGTKWHSFYECCRKCGTKEIRHNGFGLCVNCYNFELHHQSLSKWKEAS